MEEIKREDAVFDDEDVRLDEGGKPLWKKVVALIITLTAPAWMIPAGVLYLGWSIFEPIYKDVLDLL